MKHKTLALIVLTLIIISCKEKYLSSELDRIVITKDYSIEDKRTLIETEFAIDTPQNDLLYPGERYFIFFKVDGLEQASYGKLNTYLKYNIYDPEGKLYFESTGYAPQEKFSIDKNGVIIIDGGMWREFSPEDAPGEYRVEAIVNDYVTELNYKLETFITLEAGETVQDIKFNSMNELNEWADSYSVNFSSYRLTSALDFYLSQDVLEQKAYWLGFFSEILKFYPTAVPELNVILDSLEDSEKRLFVIDLLYYSGGPNNLISSMSLLTSEEFDFVNDNLSSSLPLQFVKKEMEGETIESIEAASLNLGIYKASGFFANLTTFLQVYTLAEYDEDFTSWGEQTLKELYEKDPHPMGYLSTLAPIAHKVEWISEELEAQLLDITGLSPAE